MNYVKIIFFFILILFLSCVNNEDNEKDQAFTMQQAVISGFSDWYHNGLYNIADLGAEKQNVNAVIDKLNYGTGSRPKRIAKFFGGHYELPKDHGTFKIGTKDIFKVEQCKNEKK